jgi:hypothetical protein
MIKVFSLISSIVLSFLLFTGCRNASVLSENIKYFETIVSQNKKTPESLDAIRLSHLKTIKSSLLESPLIFHSYLSELKDGRYTLYVEWSEKKFNEYNLSRIGGDSDLRKFKPIINSNADSKFEEDRNFDFVVHYAAYLLSKDDFKKFFDDNTSARLFFSLDGKKKSNIYEGER